ncbi:hypothetical protein [Pendulispora albinea]|uniref:Tetratricopeptide repeat protein n=1 Tax=Pendulispora albinea TaxID=2741071 RepID=A0ABZ2LW48_9BACT
MLFVAAPAHAQTTAAKQEARQLFDRGVAYAKQGAYAEACPMFERSEALDSGIGTQFNLADCYEHTGRPASAYKLFRMVERTARIAGKREPEEKAGQRANALLPKVPKLRWVTKEPARDLEVKVDREPAPKGDEPVLVDPGTHDVTASAPRKRPWRSSVSVTKEPRLTEVIIPALEDEPAPTAGAPAASAAREPPGDAAPQSSWSTQRTLALVTAGVGVVGLGVGTYFGLQSKSAHDDADKECPDRHACTTQAGVSKWDDATSKGTISTIAFAAGGAALVAGGILWFTAPKDPAPAAKAARVRVVPAFAPNHAGLVVSGGFM